MRIRRAVRPATVALFERRRNPGRLRRAGVRSFTYDGGGNITADSRFGTVYNYTYNKRTRLAEVAVGSTVKADYTFDALERLAIRVTQNMTPSGTTHYVYDAAGQTIAETRGGMPCGNAAPAVSMPFCGAALGVCYACAHSERRCRIDRCHDRAGAGGRYGPAA